MKHFTLRFIQIAWPVETIALIAYSMIAVTSLSPDRVSLWLQLLPLLSSLIAAQGTAAGIGPLVADKIKASAKKEAEEKCG